MEDSETNLVPHKLIEIADQGRDPIADAVSFAIDFAPQGGERIQSELKNRA